MASPPRISIVTSSFNQGPFIRETIESVRTQDYPNVEHIIVDGMSTDHTPQILADYPHLHVIREPDGGQAEAINKGMRVATGDILAFLNSDDTLMPGALSRVAQTMNPSRGIHVVMGRCAYTDEHSRPTGMEHPWQFQTHRRVLEVWKGHCIPQPSTFWSKEAWLRTGPLDEKEQLVLDYEFFCRLSRSYRFCPIDSILATYRLHHSSKTCNSPWEDTVAQASRVSRRHWGPPWKPLYWQLAASYGMYRLHRRRLALERRCRQSSAGRLGLFNQFAAACASPKALFVKAGLINAPVHRRESLRPGAPLAAMTRSCHSFASMHQDRWVGPTFTMPVPREGFCGNLIFRGFLAAPAIIEPWDLTIWAGSRCLGREQLHRAGAFSIAVPIPDVPADAQQFTIVTSHFVVPDEILRNYDFRPLSFRLDSLRLERARTRAAG